MKIRKPSFIGSVAWTIYFLAILAAIFVVVLAVSWNLVAGIGLFILVTVILGVGSRWVLSAVGYIDTEFVVGLLIAVALGLVGFALVGKLHGSGVERHASCNRTTIGLSNNLLS